MAKSVEELLKECIERLNAIDANAKKIDELPHQLALQTLSRLHVSNQGTSEYLEVQQIVDAVTALTYDRIVSIGTIVLSGNTVTIPANAQWVIANINYSNVLPIALNSPFAATGLSRKDIIVANKFNSMTLIRGTETAGITIRPNIPIDTVLVTEMDVTDSNIGNILPPNTSVNGVVTTRRNYNGTGITDFKDYVDNLPPFTVAVNEILYFEDSESNDIVLFLQRGGTYGQGHPSSARGYLKFKSGGTTQLRESRQIYTSGAQEFTLPEAAAQIVLVTVNGSVVYDYTVLSDTLVRIDLPLVPTVRVVIHYLVDLNLGTVPYYTQAQVDELLAGVGGGLTYNTMQSSDFNYVSNEYIEFIDGYWYVENGYMKQFLNLKMTITPASTTPTKFFNFTPNKPIDTLFTNLGIGSVFSDMFSVRSGNLLVYKLNTDIYVDITPPSSYVIGDDDTLMIQLSLTYKTI